MQIRWIVVPRTSRDIEKQLLARNVTVAATTRVRSIANIQIRSIVPAGISQDIGK